MSRNPDHRGATREEFERFQRERPIMLRQFATLMQLWHFCGRKDCRRAKACTGPDGAPCAAGFMQGLSDEMRATFREALRLRIQGVEGKEAWREAERKIAAHKAGMAAIPLPGGGVAKPAAEFRSRHGRPCGDHPRLRPASTGHPEAIADRRACHPRRKTWMVGTSPTMTEEGGSALFSGRLR